MAQSTRPRSTSGQVGRSLKPRDENEEVWQITVPGTIHLQVTQYSRHGGQPVTADLSVGPGRKDWQIRISTEDREYNQGLCSDPLLDPFRNGLLFRVDKDQKADEETAPIDAAVSTQDLLDIYSKNGNAFHAAVDKLSEMTLRRLRDMAEAVDASFAQVQHIDSVLEGYTKGSPQPDAVMGLDGQVRPKGSPGSATRDDA